MDTDSPKTGSQSMRKDQVDVDWNKVATGEDRKGLDECIKRVECKSSKGSDCFGVVMNDVNFFVYSWMMKKTMSPVGEKLIETNMKQ